MDKRAFINWLLDKYKVSDISYENQANKLNNGLLKNINYSKVAGHINANSNGIMPTATEINNIAKTNNFFIFDKVCPALKHLNEIDKLPKYTMFDLPKETQEKIKKFCRRYGLKTVLEEVREGV